MRDPAGRLPVTSHRAGERPRRPYRRWRAASLAAVHVLIAVHIAHWLAAARTLAPLELNEAVYTLELGIVTVGFLLLAAATLTTALFGRFFCSWGCHFLALQDLAAWALRKLRIRPRLLSSRLLRWVPLLLAAYMFLWPALVRAVRGQPAPELHVASDADGWASFVTEDFWRNLPGPVIAVLTFAVCGPILVYLAGTRAFCRYACPYGAVFAAVEPAAPGRIRLRGECNSCGLCTAACSSHVRVHEELLRFGTVVDSACLRDLDCVSACPKQAVAFGFGAPALRRRKRGAAAGRRRYDVSLAEDLAMAALFAALLVIYRGLYDQVPLLLSVGIGIAGCALALASWRLLTRPSVQLPGLVLKESGRILGPGWLVIAACLLGGALSVHSAAVHFHTYTGLAAAQGARDNMAVARAVEHLENAERWGLLAVDRVSRAVAAAAARLGHWSDAELRLKAHVREHPRELWARLELGRVLKAQGRTGAGLAVCRAAVQERPDCGQAHYALAGFLYDSASLGEARKHLESAVELEPGMAMAHFDLGALLLELGDTDGGLASLRKAIELRPGFADAHYNVAVALAMRGDAGGALAALARASELAPADERVRGLRERLEAPRS
jgi:polyferredoxin/Flp pilus assembly protein TadD